MFDTGNPLHWLIGIVVLAAVVLLWRAFYSPEGRERRRRERSHRRVISKVRRPMVSLAVKTDKSKKER
jgi:hypothetical protein